MEILIYSLIFIMGTFCGSFLTLAVYRIPLKQDIICKHSYCPNCNHRLGFWDLFPVLSYILLGGKCRYCKEKIRIRYLMYEVLTGTLFVLLALSIKINIFNISIVGLIYLLIITLYLIGILLIAGIDKERREISMPVLLYQIIISAIYIIYVYIAKKTNIYTYIIYLFIILMLLLYNVKLIKNTKKNNYIAQIVMLCMVMAISIGELKTIVTIILSIIQIAFVNIYMQLKNKNKEYKTPVGFILTYTNVITMTLINIIENYIVK